MPLSSASSIGIFTLELAVYQLSLAGTLQFVSPRFLSVPPVVQFVNYAFTILSLVQLAVSTALLFSAAEVRGTLRRGYLCGVSQGFAVLFLLLWACAFVAQWFGFPRVASTSAPTSYVATAVSLGFYAVSVLLEVIILFCSLPKAGRASFFLNSFALSALGVVVLTFIAVSDYGLFKCNATDPGMHVVVFIATAVVCLGLGVLHFLADDAHEEKAKGDWRFNVWMFPVVVLNVALWGLAWMVAENPRRAPVILTGAVSVLLQALNMFNVFPTLWRMLFPEDEEKDDDEFEESSNDEDGKSVLQGGGKSQKNNENKHIAEESKFGKNSKSRDQRNSYGRNKKMEPRLLDDISMAAPPPQSTIVPIDFARVSGGLRVRK
jgi:hypothetical protein